MRTLYISLGIGALLLVGYLFTLPNPSDIATDEAPILSSEEAEVSALGKDKRDNASRVPSFSIVRVDPTGEAVIAGRALPGTDVTVMMGDTPVGDARADTRGEWVLIVEEPLTPGNQEMYLLGELPGGAIVRSEQKVAVAVPERKGLKPLVVLSEPGQASRVLQRPGDPSEGLSLEAIDYDEQGNVIFSGFAKPHGAVRVYVDNDLVGSADAGEAGFWEVKADTHIAPGVHKLRVDELDEANKVAARAELPFNRTAPELLLISEGQVVIQPGNNLWTIARYLYGSGFKYTVIFQANQDQIRDPDLIYPGQVFATPEVAGQSGSN